MLKTIVLAKNAFEPQSWTTHETANVCEFLQSQFDVWPDTARIYNGNVSESTDVTPRDDAGIARLNELDGPFYVVVYPGYVSAIWYVVALIVAVVVVAVVLKAKIPNTALRNTQEQSPNNDLAERTNKPRPLARIPDIYGTVRSTPDLLAVPYSLFINHIEVEYAYMCVGRGLYEVSDVRDDTTLIADIDGASVEVYGPNTSPNSGDSPQLRIGSDISEPVLNVKRSNSVNGQVLRSPNGQSVVGDNNIRFVTPNVIEIKPDSGLKFGDKFSSGDLLHVQNASLYSSYVTQTQEITAYSDGYFEFAVSAIDSNYVAGAEITIVYAKFFVYDEFNFSSYQAYSLSGTYKIDSVETEMLGGLYLHRITLINPSNINSDWALADGELQATASLKISTGTPTYDFNGSYLIVSLDDSTIHLSDPASVSSSWTGLTASSYMSPTVTTSGDKWVGPFIIDGLNRQKIYANFVALNGLYKDDGQNQQQFDVTLELEATPINADGSSRGSVESWQAVVQGSAIYRTTRAISVKVVTALAGRYSVRARRVTASDLSFKGSVVDEVKWRDLYAVSDVDQTHFGNVTTIQSVTFVTSGALTLKERKLNVLASRKIESKQEDGSFAVMPTSNAADILRAVCLDPYIGNRSVDEIDITNFYESVAAVESYFGTSIASKFNHTFDNTNVSFEEMAISIADAVFCQAYRRGNVIKLAFEKATQDSVLLFNHRNKLPGSETRTINFGNNNDNDGIEFQYVDPEDDALVTLYLPEDRSAVNPKKIESVGIRNRLQAWFHAWRDWNKIRYSNQVVEFEATQEADLIIPQDRILVADNTRPSTQDGDVIGQNGLELELSHDVTFETGVTYTVFIQHVDGTVESIQINSASASNKIVLANPPRAALALGEDLYARATYVIVGNNSARQNAFLVSEKTPNDNFTSNIKAINYDDRYYDNDADFINGVVDVNGIQI
jgi:hypothetical protein